MAVIAAERVTPRGVGVPYVDLAAGQLQVPASRSGIAHIRNRGTGELRLTCTVDDGAQDSLGPRNIDVAVPAGAQRFVALSLRMADQATQVITFTVAGDVSKADIAVLERAL